MATYYVRTDGSDANAGTGPATNQAWQTITKAIGATGIAPGDTLYIAPGVYRGAFVCGFTNPSSNAQRITIAGNPTASLFSGVTAGPVIITNFTGPTTASGLTFGSTNKDYVSLIDLHFVGYQAGASPDFGAVVSLTGTYPIVTRCSFYTPVQSIEAYAFYFYAIAGTRGPTIEECVFFGHTVLSPTTAGSSYDSQSLFRNCIFINENTGGNTTSALRVDSGSTSATFGGVRVINCRFMAAIGVRPFPSFRISQTFPVVIQNCIFECPVGIQATVTGDYVESYNVFNCSTERTNVATGTGSISRAFISPDFSLSRLSGWGNLPFWSNHSSSASQNAGINTNSDTVDFYGVTWLAPTTPTIGPIEFFSNTTTGVYTPTERNASTITIAPGSTSQSIELYLGATGLTASTSGLSARYNRTRTASVDIPLVARTIAQAWTSGGFAEVDSTNMPGVYRIDLPDAALAAGADDVTIVVRGASGTNGAVMTVKLSSGGLTSAQTAAAVWDEARSSHVTAGTFGQYVNAELVTPVTSAALVRMGPYEVKADGLGATDPLDIQKGAQHGVDIQCVDAFGSGIDITSATVTAKVYNSGATLVDTYACTATYAADGRATFVIDTTVTDTPGTYTATITRTTGASDTQIFGPLRIYVRDI